MDEQAQPQKENSLATAIQKFHDRSIKRMASANAWDEPTKPLFHYTNENALFSIIDSEKFWFTSIYHMDDREELSFGFGVSQSLLKEAINAGDKLIQIFCNELVSEEDLAKIKNLFEFYSVSFGVRDDRKQWETYADNGRGVALGLSPPFFKPLAVENVKPEEHIYLGKVIYGEPEARKRHSFVINDALDTIKQAINRGLIKNGLDAQTFFRHIAAEMTVETLWNSVTTKDESWSHQQETRLLALNNLKQPHVKIYNKDKRPRLELPQPLLKENITEVMVGPQAQRDAEIRIRNFLDKHSLGHVQIAHAQT